MSSRAQAKSASKPGADSSVLSSATMLRAATGVLALRVVAAIVSVALLIALGRTLDPDSLGAFLYAWGWLELLSVVATLGFDPLIVRTVPVALGDADWPMLRGVLRAADCGPAAAALLLLVVAALGWPWWKDVLAPHAALCVVIALVALPVRVIAIIRQSTLVAAERPVLALSMMPVMQPGLVLVTIVGLVLSGVPLNGARVMVVAGVAMLATAIFGVVMVRVVLDRTVLDRAQSAAHTTPARAEHRPFANVDGVGSWVAVAAPFFVLIVADLANTRIDLLVVGTVLGPREAADYGVAARAGEVIRFGLLAVTPVVAPTMARLAARGHTGELAMVTRRAARIVLGLTIPIVGFVLLAAPLLLSVVGPEYTSASAVLRVLALGYLAATVAGPAVRLLLSAGQERVVAQVLVCGALANLVLDLAVVGRFGLIGPATVTAVVTATTIGVLAVVADRRLGVSTVAWARG
ncbi:MAG: O-antigen/teichoic acid export membrane protein [Hyphomicrobiaceae bacterium]|jgi:O-antigen/teichoic acid export membrane protein